MLAFSDENNDEGLGHFNKVFTSSAQVHAL
jgi:hypothetical protein